jgi:hypothetical protein
VILSRSLQLRLQHLSCTVPWAAARLYHLQHAADLRNAAVTLLSQPDPRIAGLNPTAIILELHLQLREGALGVSDFSPAASDADFISSAMRAASSLSATTTHLHPFAVRTSTTSACWHFLYAKYPDLCPSLAKRLTAVAATQLTQLPTRVRRALTRAVNYN